MSTVIILTPIIIGGWPSIMAAVVGAASALGLVVKETVKEEIKQQQAVEQSVEIELANSEVLAQNLASGKEVVLTKGDIEIRVGRDERGRCRVCAKGKGHTKSELKQIAEEFSRKMTQCFDYNRVATELKNKGFQMVNEEVMEDQSIRINVRRWVD
jgi:hypothetical protein